LADDRCGNRFDVLALLRGEHAASFTLRILHSDGKWTVDFEDLDEPDCRSVARCGPTVGMGHTSVMAERRLIQFFDLSSVKPSSPV
jgi:hypothetical protein